MSWIIGNPIERAIRSYRKENRKLNELFEKQSKDLIEAIALGQDEDACVAVATAALHTRSHMSEITTMIAQLQEANLEVKDGNKYEKYDKAMTYVTEKLVKIDKSMGDEKKLTEKQVRIEEASKSIANKRESMLEMNPVVAKPKPELPEVDRAQALKYINATKKFMNQNKPRPGGPPAAAPSAAPPKKKESVKKQQQPKRKEIVYEPVHELGDGSC